MSIAYKIKVIKNENAQIFDLGDVSHDINMLMSCLELQYQPTISLAHVLTTEEAKLLIIQDGESSIIESIQTKATVMKHILRKLQTEIYKIGAKSFANYLESIKTRTYNHNIHNGKWFWD